MVYLIIISIIIPIMAYIIFIDIALAIIIQGGWFGLVVPRFRKQKLECHSERGSFGGGRRVVVGGERSVGLLVER